LFYGLNINTRFLQFDSSQAAETARAAVDGLHWPDTSPKTLSAAFISALDASQLKTSLVSSLSIKKPDTQQLMKAVASTKQQPARVEPPRVVKSVESSLDRNTNSKSFTITARSVVSEQVAALATFELEQSGRSVVDTDGTLLTFSASIFQLGVGNLSLLSILSIPGAS
jgi:hypothetical protein